MRVRTAISSLTNSTYQSPLNNGKVCNYQAPVDLVACECTDDTQEEIIALVYFSDNSDDQQKLEILSTTAINGIKTESWIGMITNDN
ncbi:hypothetical protein Trydic_g17636 [Trypoxylus dichotomus]